MGVDMALANPAPDYFKPEDGMFLATLLIVRDTARSREYYERVFGATCVHEENPLIMKFLNSYIIINVEGGPTDDKPTVQAKAPTDSNTLSCAMNVRVTDIRKLYQEWKARGADFLTEPKDHGTEIRCYLRDPDGYLVEIGQGL
ncbi:VOC family protein [Rugosimonospora acidiphila]|uniref:VOC family protein n=2 Tax=Rugosimonospora acidiphila TaxID=556531 RepID=A0ABP9SD33_9ACTN